jgi:hypothetical protein
MTTVLETEPATASETSPKRDAIIFIPGIGRQWNDQSLESMSNRIASAMDVKARTRQATFRSEVQFKKFGGDPKTKVCTITRTNDREHLIVADMYEYDYREPLAKMFQDRSLFWRSFLTFMALVRNFFSFGRMLLRGKSKRLSSRLQAFFTMLVFSLIFLYMFFLLLALLTTVVGVLRPSALAGQPANQTANAPQASQAPGAGPSTSPATRPARTRTERFKDVTIKTLLAVSGFLLWLGELAQPWLLVFVAIGVFAPGDIKKRISDAAVDYLALLYYLDSGEGRNKIVGDLERLLENLAESKEPAYQEIHIVAYSFGSMIAIDTLFPISGAPCGAVKNVGMLVTIGSPFDIVRAFLKNYFTEREGLEGHPRKWVNVFTPLDALGSNFSNRGDDATKADVTVSLIKDKAVLFEPPKPVNFRYTLTPGENRSSFGSALFLWGLRSHSMYWEKDSEVAPSCFRDVVWEMYKDTSVLA